MKKRGFTLIELLVVISIIALLLSILMPSLQKVKVQAKAVVCMSQLKQWGPVFYMYTEDNRGNFGEGWNMEDGHQWPTTYKPYYDNEALLRCPAAIGSFVEGNAGPLSSWGNSGGSFGEGVFAAQGGIGSYGLNEWISNPVIETIGWRNYKENSWRSMNKLTKAKDIPVLLDSWWPGSLPLTSDLPPDYEATAMLNGLISGDEMKKHTIRRHDEGVVSSFADLSVRRVGLRQMWELKWHRNSDTKFKTSGNDVESRSVWPGWMRNLKNY